MMGIALWAPHFGQRMVSFSSIGAIWLITSPSRVADSRLRRDERHDGLAGA
jgi:hypothetical protein